MPPLSLPNIGPNEAFRSGRLRVSNRWIADLTEGGSSFAMEARTWVVAASSISGPIAGPKGRRVWAQLQPGFRGAPTQDGIPDQEDVAAPDMRDILAFSRDVSDRAALLHRRVDGMEIDARRGSVLEAFLNPRVNQRHDAYGGRPERRIRLILDTVDAVRQQMGRKPTGLLLNVDAISLEEMHDDLACLLEEMTRRQLDFVRVEADEEAEDFVAHHFRGARIRTHVLPSVTSEFGSRRADDSWPLNAVRVLHEEEPLAALKALARSA